jgi:hypothetical protein
MPTLVRTPGRIRKPRARRRWGVIALAAAAAPVFSAAADPPRPGFDWVYYDSPDDAGRLTGGRVLLEVPPAPPALRRRVAGVQCLYESGSPVNRIDLVFVGDGYTAGELGQYAQDVDVLAAAYFQREPFVRYAAMFNVHRVDVVSNESGVDNDPLGVLKDTALDMTYWCAGIDRLLCVNVGKAYAHAAVAPDVDLVAAIANSTTYGGAGYIANDLATSAGRNFWSPEILLHEFGHALGNLADEYDYGDGATYNGPELVEPNASVLGAAQMAGSGKKWDRWLGTNDSAFDGLVWTFEGAVYHQFGAYRPTSNSLMRSLGRPFNLPSIEATIIEMYRIVAPIDAASPEDVVYTGAETLSVSPVPLAGDPPMETTWRIGGQVVGTSPDLHLPSLGLTPGGWYIIDLVVRDGTSWVRDEVARASLMTQTRKYLVVVPLCPADCNGDGALNIFDFLCFQGKVTTGDPGADCNGDGSINIFDFLCFQGLVTKGCE